MLAKSEAFMRNSDAYLKALVKEFKYDTCHRIDGIDASQCAEDCEKSSRTAFGQDCTALNGTFKCCIRLLTITYCKDDDLNLITDVTKSFAMNAGFVAR